jgi:hypothetical protein
MDNSATVRVASVQCIAVVSPHKRQCGGRLAPRLLLLLLLPVAMLAPSTATTSDDVAIIDGTTCLNILMRAISLDAAGAPFALSSERRGVAFGRASAAVEGGTFRRHTLSTPPNMTFSMAHQLELITTCSGRRCLFFATPASAALIGAQQRQQSQYEGEADAPSKSRSMNQGNKIK